MGLVVIASWVLMLAGCKAKELKVAHMEIVRMRREGRFIFLDKGIVYADESYKIIKRK